MPLFSKSVPGIKRDHVHLGIGIHILTVTFPYLDEHTAVPQDGATQELALLSPFLPLVRLLVVRRTFLLGQRSALAAYLSPQDE